MESILQLQNLRINLDHVTSYKIETNENLKEYVCLRLSNGYEVDVYPDEEEYIYVSDIVKYLDNYYGVAKILK